MLFSFSIPLHSLLLYFLTTEYKHRRIRTESTRSFTRSVVIGHSMLYYYSWSYLCTACMASPPPLIPSSPHPLLPSSPPLLLLCSLSLLLFSCFFFFYSGGTNVRALAAQCIPTRGQTWHLVTSGYVIEERGERIGERRGERGGGH